MNEVPYGYCQCGCGQKTRKDPRGYPCKFKRGHTSLSDFFWTKVAITADDQKCWEWTASLLNGYGSFKVNRKTRAAHKVAWELTNGTIPEGLWVLHKCDNPKCVNPNHLYLGTHADNTRDMVERGRSVKGERTHAHKLTNVTVAEIRHKYAIEGTAIRALARDYKVSQRAIQFVVRGESWKPKCMRCNDLGVLSISGDQTVDCPICNPMEGEVTF